MFRFADTNETSARVLDEALQICADPRWALPRSSTPASPTSPEISALYARALEAKGKAQNEGGTAVKDLFR
eukprot:scaffold13_cov241-Pinguiococcus_pyrenoidosus.AAC.39